MGHGVREEDQRDLLGSHLAARGLEWAMPPPVSLGESLDALTDAALPDAFAQREACASPAALLGCSLGLGKGPGNRVLT